MSESDTLGAAVATRPRPRPRFELESVLAREEVLARVKARLRGQDAVRGLVLPHGRIELTVSDHERHIWSPQLTVDVEPEGEASSRMRARFGPHAHVWTMYVALYGVSVMFAIGCAVYGASQWTLGREPWALYLTPLAVVFSALVFGAAWVGQGLGSDQMYALRTFLEQALETEVEVPDAQG